MAKTVQTEDIKRLYKRLITMKGYRDVLGIRHAYLNIHDKDSDKILEFDMSDLGEFLNNVETVIRQPVRANFVSLSYEETFTGNGVIWMTMGDVEEPSFDRDANGAHIEPNGSDFADLDFGSLEIISEVARHFKEWWELLDWAYVRYEE